MEYYYDLVAHYGCEFTDLLKNFLRSRYEKGQRFEDEVHVSAILPVFLPKDHVKVKR